MLIEERTDHLASPGVSMAQPQSNAAPSSDRATEQARFFFVTPVWGVNHLSLFLEIGLPSLLAPGNLPGLSHPSDCRYLIYTRACDEQRLTDAESFRKLKTLIPVEVHRIPEPLANAHRVMSDCHIAALRRVDAEDAAAVFIPPDCVWANGGMVRLEALANAGKSMVHISGIRLDRDSVVPRLRNHLGGDRCTLNIDPRALVSVGLAHLHPIAILHFWKERGGGLMPANLYWTVPGEGLALRCFHLHPLMVKPQKKFAQFNSTIDDDLGLFACPDESRDYIVSDSDEILTFEMSGPERVITGDFKKGDVDSVAAWMEVGTNVRHHFLATHPIRIHSGPMSEAKWQGIEHDGEELIAALTRINRSSSLRLALRHPMVLSYRRYAISVRGGRYAGRADPLSRHIIGALVRAAQMRLLLHAMVRRVPQRDTFNPLISNAYARWAIFKARLRFLDSAIADFTRAIAHYPDNPFLYLLRGRVFLLKRDIERATADFQAGLKIRSDIPELVALLKKLQCDDDAASDLTSCFKNRPWFFSSEGTMRSIHPKWMIYRSLLPMLSEIVSFGNRRSPSGRRLRVPWLAIATSAFNSDYLFRPALTMGIVGI